MEFTIKKEVLVKALQKVDKVIDNKPLHIILTGLLLQVFDNHLKITGSSGELSITTTIKNTEGETGEILSVERNGSVVLPAKKFSSIAKALPDREVFVSLDTENKQVNIKSGKSKFVLQTMNAEEYPRLPQVNEKGTFVVNGVEFSDGLNKTVFVTAKDQTKPHFTGINIISGEGTLTMNATDTHRLNRKNSIAYEGDSFEGIILPEKSAKEIAKLIKNCGKVDVYITDNLAIFKTEDDVIYSKLIAGNYPDVTKIIPQEFQITVTVSKAGLLSALDRAMILAKEDNKIVTLEIGAENETIFESIKVYQRGNEIGKSNEIVAVDKVEGGEITISFNADYVIDALKHIDDERIEMKFNNSVHPFMIVGEETKNEFLQVIMPVRPY